MAADFNIEMQLKNDLWAFALNFYQQPGVESACLLLQEQFGLSINRIIYAAWCGCEGQSLRVNEALLQADKWQKGITHPLRAVRYAVREQKKSDPALDTCYQALRKAELACEQVELALLYEQHQQHLSKDEREGTTLLGYQNIEIYLNSHNVELDSELELILGPILSAINHYLGTNRS